jgi:hypothetical protein
MMLHVQMEVVAEVGRICHKMTHEVAYLPALDVLVFVELLLAADAFMHPTAMLAQSFTVRDGREGSVLPQPSCVRLSEHRVWRVVQELLTSQLGVPCAAYQNTSRFAFPRGLAWPLWKYDGGRPEEFEVDDVAYDTLKG